MSWYDWNTVEKDVKWQIIHSSILLTNVISFEQLGPGGYIKWQYSNSLCIFIKWYKLLPHVHNKNRTANNNHSDTSTRTHNNDDHQILIARRSCRDWIWRSYHLFPRGVWLVWSTSTIIIIALVTISVRGYRSYWTTTTCHSEWIRVATRLMQRLKNRMRYSNEKKLS